MRLSPRSSRVRGRPVLSVAGMIDAVFLLLSYFLLTTAFIRPEDRLAPALGGAQGGSAGDLSPQIVDVRVLDGREVFVLGTRSFSERESLTEALRGLPREPGLFVRVHPGPTVAAAAAAMQAAHDAGFERVTWLPGKETP